MKKCLTNQFGFNRYLILFFIVAYQSANAQLPEFGWAKRTGGPEFAIAQSNCVTADREGNVYTAGIFTGTTDFDPDPETTYNLTSLNNPWGGIASQIFVTKFDAEGHFIWAKNFGNNQGFDFPGVIVVKQNHVFIAGTFYDATDFDPGPLVNTLQATNGGDVFLLKLDTDGNFVWVKNIASGSDSSYCTALKIDDSGNIYTSGTFFTDADFDPDPLVTQIMYAGGYRNPYISKLSPEGEFMWAKIFVGGGYNIGMGIDLDASGNVYATGDFSYPCDFDPGSGSFIISPIYNDAAESDQKFDVYVAKLDKNGNFVWAKSLGGNINDHAATIKTDREGNSYIAGNFRGTADFNPDQDAVFNLASSGDYDMFVCKLDASGNFVWAKSFGGAGHDDLRQIDLDSFGNVYAIGNFLGSDDFDPDPANVFNLTSAGGLDIFMSKLDSNGHFIWARNFGGSDTRFGNSDSGQGIFVNEEATAIYASGWFDGTSDFDPTAADFNITALGTSGGDYSQNEFVLKWKQLSPLSTAESVIQNGNIYPNPFGDHIYFDLETPSQITIHTMLGQLVLNQSFSSGRQYIQTANLKKGTYLVKLVTNGKTTYKKMIKS